MLESYRLSHIIEIIEFLTAVSGAKVPPFQQRSVHTSMRSSTAAAKHPSTIPAMTPPPISFDSSSVVIPRVGSVIL